MWVNHLFHQRKTKTKDTDINLIVNIISLYVYLLLFTLPQKYAIFVLQNLSIYISKS